MIYLKLIWSYLKIGLFGFGGGYAMLTLIEREIVGNGWITSTEFTDIVAISQMTPGPIGINSATYIGYIAPHAGPWMGLLGSIVCTLTVVLPSYLLVLFTAHYVHRHKDSAAIKGIFRGLRPVTIGLIASAALLLMNGDNFGTSASEIAISVGICAAAFVATYFAKVHPILVICAAGLLGFIIF